MTIDLTFLLWQCSTGQSRWLLMQIQKYEQEKKNYLIMNYKSSWDTLTWDRKIVVRMGGFKSKVTT